MGLEKDGRVVFIGNIPYGVSEEQIIETFTRCGQVVNFRLLHDKETGRPKGFGFLQYSDADAAASAVRNLNDFELMGRKLRVDFSNDGGSTDSAPAGYNAPPPQPTMNGQDNRLAQSSALPPLPPGADLPPDLTCPDAISRTLSTLPAPQLLDILSQMKGLIMTDPLKATELLRQAPQLSYAIFQSLLLLNLVDKELIATVVEMVSAQPTQRTPQVPPQTAYAAPPPQPAYPQYPPQMHAPTPPIHQAPYAPPPPPPQQYQPPPQPQAAQGMATQQQQLIAQVLAMTQQQINALDPTSRAQIVALRQQLGAPVF
ncbi:hypothetical protein BJ546DRAFT_1026659 [Cryomyces antarcticus]|nr:hypothetical protein LTR04_003540 [Oleoguttula sp. CCFEE 6159]